MDDVFDSVAGHLNVQHARMVGAAAWLLDNVGEWQGDGVWTPEAYVAWRTGVARATAAKVVDVARRVGEFPACVAVMGRGELSLDQMVPIVRYAPGWADAQMSGLATRLTVRQISKIAREYPWDSNEWGQPIEPRPADADAESADPASPGVTMSSRSRARRVPARPDHQAVAWVDRSLLTRDGSGGMTTAGSAFM